tara:strand:+ start:1777 stop:2373 length:597 start_codon:yes stop_codon:yes gene_type:complete
MKIEKIKLYKIKGNKANPRVIKNDKFYDLVKSIKNFPEMLDIRPIVVDEDLIVLGGNMRLKAAKEAGLKEVSIIKASELSEEKQKEFIVKDNISAGEWDWDTLANEWDAEKLQEYGLDVPIVDGIENIEEQEIEFSEYLDEANNYVVLLFNSDVDWLGAQTHFELKSVHSKRANGKPWSKGIGRVIDGAEYLKSIKSE